MSSVDWSDTDAPQYFEAKKMKQPAETISETLGSVSGYARDMTLRDYFAGLAMQVLFRDTHRDLSNIALNSYRVADAMIEERHK